VKTKTTVTQTTVRYNDASVTLTMIDSAASFTESIKKSVESGNMAVSSTDLTSLVGTFNLVQAEHSTNVKADVSAGKTGTFVESSTVSVGVSATASASGEASFHTGKEAVTVESSVTASASAKVT